MPTENKISQLILRLTKATVNKEIEWKPFNPPKSLTTGNDDLIVACLTADYKQQTLALVKGRFRDYDGSNDTFYWTGSYSLAILNAAQSILWEHRENSSALGNLFQVAHEAAMNVDQILDSLLG